VKQFTLFSLSLLLLLSACSEDSTVIKYDKSLQQLPCLRLVVFPPDKLITNKLMQLYTFDEKCNYELQVSKKSAIVCNSNQNADKKALSNFPSGYIRMDIYKNHKPIYSYYKDLTCKVSQDDIESAFKRLKSDLLEE